QDFSEDTAVRIDQEVKAIVTANYERAYRLLDAHREELVRIADALLMHEVLDGDQVRRLSAGATIEEVTGFAPAQASVSTDDEARARARDRGPVVPPIPPIQKPLPQE
ncbi:MAG: hypothetical protein EHM24_10905, partial [Acidobacteria bacterium]